MIVYPGNSIPANPRLSVIVMSIDSDPVALTALSKIDCPGVEKILVNTGSGSFLGKAGLDDVILVEDERRRFPGGTRNLGILQASAPIIAFLAGDCIMTRETLEKRISAHNAGYDLVSSALRPFSDSFASWVSYVYLHKNRMPEFQKSLGASLFGVSYRREVFDAVGYFDETMRLAEDVEFNKRCKDFSALMAGDIITYHRYPESLPAVFRDIARRALREMQFFNRSGLKQGSIESLKAFRISVRMITSTRAPYKARMAALLIPLVGLWAAFACLRKGPLASR